MVDSLVKVVIESGVDWVRKFVTKRLENGDVSEQKLSGLIESGFGSIKRDLEAQRRQSLASSLRLFKEGITCACDEHGISHDDDDYFDGPPVRRQRIDGLSSGTKERFKEARTLATQALGNSSLSTKDRILATYIKVMATMLEEDDPARAVKLCKTYLEQLHSFEDIISNFKTELLPSPVKRRLNADERRHIILSVCHVNRVVFDMGQETGDIGGDELFKELFIWPCIKLKKATTVLKIDPLRYCKLREINFLSDKMCHSVIECHSVQTSTNEQHTIKGPSSIAVTAQGQYLVVDNSETILLDNRGNYLRKPLMFHAVDLDTDKEGNIYLLVTVQNSDESCYEVIMFKKDYSLDRSIQLRPAGVYKSFKLAVSREHNSKKEVLVLKKLKEEGDLHRHAKIDVYETVECTYISHFGGNVLMDAQDLVCDGNGHTFVLDKCHCGSEKKPHIWEFGPGGNPHRSFQVDIDTDPVAITFHQASKYIVFASICNDSTNKVQLSWYTTDGKKDHHDVLKVADHEVQGTEIVPANLTITATTKARIVVAYQGKIIVY